MSATSNYRAPIPESFGSLEAAAEWWDEHSLADFQDQSRPVTFESNIASGELAIPISREVAELLRTRADEENTPIHLYVVRLLHESLISPRARKG